MKRKQDLHSYKTGRHQASGGKRHCHGSKQRRAGQIPGEPIVHKRDDALAESRCERRRKGSILGNQEQIQHHIGCGSGEHRDQILLFPVIGYELRSEITRCRRGDNGQHQPAKQNPGPSILASENKLGERNRENKAAHGDGKGQADGGIAKPSQIFFLCSEVPARGLREQGQKHLTQDRRKRHCHGHQRITRDVGAEFCVGAKVLEHYHVNLVIDH